MMSPPDPFALHFDSIPVEPKSDERAAMVHFGAHTSYTPKPAPDATGFYLIDDANGRFTIDRSTGVITLADESLLSIESGAVHPVHMRVVESSGASYDMKMRLRMTGRVPQMAGAEENDMLAGLASAPLVDLMTPEEKGVHAVVAPEPPALAWTAFSAFKLHVGKSPLYGETAPFGGLFGTPAALPDVYVERGVLSIGAAPPAPAAAISDWAL